MYKKIKVDKGFAVCIENRDKMKLNKMKSNNSKLNSDISISPLSAWEAILLNLTPDQKQAKTESRILAPGVDSKCKCLS